MKKSGLTAACILTVLALCLAAAFPALAEGPQPDGESDVFAGKVLILPFANGDYYSQTDPENRILGTLEGLFQMLPADGSVTYAVLPFGEKMDQADAAGPQEAFSKVSVKGKSNTHPGSQLDEFLKNRSNVKLMLVLDCSNDWKDSWNKLKEIANSGTKVVFIEIENSQNKTKKKKFEDFVGGALTPNRIIPTITDDLSFCWINDTETPLETLLPLFEELTGRRYTAVRPGEDGEYSIDLFSSLTEQVRLAVQQGSKPDDDEEETARILADGTAVRTGFENSALTLATADEGTGKITVSSDAKAVYYEKQEKSTAGITLSITMGNNRVFNVKENNTYYVAMNADGIEEAAFAADLESRGIEMKLRNDDGSLEQSMQWNEKERRWETTVEYDRSGEWRLYAETDPGEGRLPVRSEVQVITVENQKPAVALENGMSAGTEEDPVRLWINDPWNEKTQSRVTIPLTASDDEGGQVALTVEKDDGSYGGSTFITGLGTVSVSNKGKKRQIEITLNKQGEKLEVNTDTTFLITVKGSDGELDSDPLPIRIVLQDLSAEIQQVRAGSIETDDPLTKKQQFEVRFALDVSGCKDPERVLAVLSEKAKYSAGLTGQEAVPMQYDKDRNVFRAYFSRDDAGETEITVTEALEPAILPVPDMKGITVTGSTPVKQEDAESPEYGEERIDKDGKDYWETNPIKGSALFRDEDEDDITILAVVTGPDGKRQTLKPGEENTAVYYEAAADDQEGTAEPLEIPADQEFRLRFREEGTYTVTLKAKDVDGESEGTFEFSVSLVSLKTLIITNVKQYAPYAAAGLVLLLIFAWVLKPSYKNRILQLTTATEDAEQTAELPLKGWKKAKKPFWQVLSCAAFPPEPELFEQVSKVEIKPTRKGIRLLNAGNLTGRDKRVKIDEDHPFNCQLGETTLTITMKKAEEV